MTALRALWSALRALFLSTSTKPLAVAWYAVGIAVFKGRAIDLSFMCFSALSLSLTLAGHSRAPARYENVDTNRFRLAGYVRARLTFVSSIR
jgi:hypothetical protein